MSEIHFNTGNDWQDNDFTIIKKPVPVLSLEHFTQDENDTENDLQKLINTCRIDLTERLAPPPVSMQIMSEGKPITLFTKGNFSIVTGAAKSRKTFLLSMLIATAIKGKTQDQFYCEGEGLNILFDTEQSKYKAQQIGKRICNLSETVNPENLEIYSLRTLDPDQRIELIDRVLATTPNIKFVAIDGIIDLDIDPILQADQAQRIVSKLMQWSEIYHCHIVCVLHYNKTVATLLGHLGSFSHRKAESIIEVSKCKEDNTLSLVKALDCREQEFAPFAFSVDPVGMPFIYRDYTFVKIAKEAKAPKPKAITPHDLGAEKHSEILTLTFKIIKEYGYSDLWRSIKNAGAQLGLNIGNNKAMEFIPYYLQNQSIILTEVPKKKNPVYTLAGQSEILFTE